MAHGHEACWADRMQTGGKWNAVFQLVFQLKIEIVIDFINQQVTEPIQITPAHQLNENARPVRALSHLEIGI